MNPDLFFGGPGESKILALPASNSPDGIVALRRDLTLAQRKAVVLQTLERAVMQLEVMGDDIAEPDLLSRLDEIETRLSRRRFSLRMRQGLVHLIGVMGRAP